MSLYFYSKFSILAAVTAVFLLDRRDIGDATTHPLMIVVLGSVMASFGANMYINIFITIIFSLLFGGEIKDTDELRFQVLGFRFVVSLVLGYIAKQSFNKFASKQK